MILKRVLFVFSILFFLGSFIEAETISDLEKELLQNSPDIAAASNRYLAAMKVPVQKGTLPDPVLSFTDAGVGHPLSSLNASEFAYRSFGFSQEFPFPGKLSLRSKIASVQAQTVEKEIRIIRLRLLSELRAAVAEYLYLRHAITIATGQQKFLEQIAEIAQAKYRVGQGLQSDVLRSQLEQSMLVERLEILEEDSARQQGSVNALLNRDVSGPLEITDMLSETPLNDSLQDLEKKVKENSPELQSKAKAEERQSLELQLAHKDLYPDFTAGFQWQKTGANFSDYYMTTLSVRLPLYSWRRQKPAIAQAELELNAKRQDTESTARRLFADLQEQVAIATRSARLLKLYTEAIIPQTRLSLESLFASYQAGKADFLALLNTSTTLLDYQCESERQLADHEKAIARIQAMTGLPVETEPLAEEVGK